MLRNIVQGLALVGVVMGVGAAGAGCLDRPVTAASPTIKTNFTTAVTQSGINKVDILFDIDNSASMGDKQSYLIQAIPQMIARLVTPNCVDNNGKPETQGVGGPTIVATNGTCSVGTPEFTAVHDMHIGVVTSSLGSRLGVVAGTSKVCDPNTTVKSAAGTTVSAFNDDQGRLINRTSPLGSGPPIAEATLSESGGFLYWFPTTGNGTTTPATVPASPITQIGSAGSADTLVGDFTELVGGAGESGCGIESQLESWYRFLVQPDPYGSIVPGATGSTAVWSGVDTTILQQRKDFLRPDSLLAVIVLSDENDSEIDVRSYQGTGYNFMSDTYSPPRATTACETDPSSAACASCPSNCPATGGTGLCADPNCSTNGGVFNASADTFDWGWDLNLRHVHMEQKYALNPQFPLSRYLTGLTSLKVPNRLGEYPAPTDAYQVGNNNCTNPIFASVLPGASAVADATALTPTEINTTLCALPGGAVRTPSDVFFAHIGGVPHQLLQSVPGGADGLCPAGTAAADCPQKDELLTSDWVKILGAGAAGTSTKTAAQAPWDYTDIDPHMVESMTPRTQTGLPNSDPLPTVDPSGTNALAGPAFGTGADPVRPDPVNGREWTTNAGTHSLQVDREYACIFQLPPASQRDCSTLVEATIEGNSCDCVPGGAWASGGAAAATTNTPDQVPPLCSKASTDGTITSSVSDYTVQTYAKAYPTIRELTLANLMGAQGIVSSLCPIHTEDNANGDDPLYGYRPAVNAIVNRLKTALGSTCVPKLTPDPTTKEVPCLVLVSFTPVAAKAAGLNSQADCATFNPSTYSAVPAAVLSEFQASQPDAGGLASDITCALNQVSVAPGATCSNASSSSAQGWCYVTGVGGAAVSGSTCTQEIAYSATSVVPEGTTLNLQCISTNTAADAATTATGDAAK